MGQRVRNETSGKTSKKIMMLNKQKRSLTFEQVLSPLQEELINDCTRFWNGYCNGPSEIINQLNETLDPNSRTKHTEAERNLRNGLEKLQDPENMTLPPWSTDQTHTGRTARRKHLAALARLHQFRLYNLSEVISQVQHIDKKTKNIIIEGSSIEMAIIRAAYMQETD